MKGTYFISGIDTDIGKSIATGWLARDLVAKGNRVITQKMIQTGNTGYSEDIGLHRRIMGIGMMDEDRSGLTAPVIYSYPASPHLAAQLDNRKLDTQVITHATNELALNYDIVLLEGAGGLMVPLTEELLTIDYVAGLGYPVILVTSGRLGSINHTLLSLEALKTRHMSLHSIIYNLAPATDTLITKDTMEFIKKYTTRLFPEASFLVMPEVV